MFVRALFVLFGFTFLVSGALVLYLLLTVGLSDNFGLWVGLQFLRTLPNIELVSLGVAVVGLFLFLFGLFWSRGGE